MSLKKTRSDLTLPVALAATVPILVTRLGFSFLRMKAKRRRGVRAFHKALVRGGMSRRLADRFAAEYEGIGRLRTYLPAGLRLRSFPFMPGAPASRHGPGPL